MTLLTEKAFKVWYKKQNALTQKQTDQAGFSGKPESACVLIDAKGEPSCVVAGISSPIAPYDMAFAVQAVEKFFKNEDLKNISFFLESEEKDLTNAYLGWALGCYQFTPYKQKTPPKPALLVKGESIKAHALAEGIFLLKDLVNQPANILGPAEIEEAVRAVAARHKAKVKTVMGEALLKENFP
ncbi:MAG: hypothetical protein LRY36_01305, partial [Alphaproteobacteria bacterium]|nr:hypothetical protein [Alphaproteobacteria bacterium]